MCLTNDDATFFATSFDWRFTRPLTYSFGAASAVILSVVISSSGGKSSESFDFAVIIDWILGLLYSCPSNWLAHCARSCRSAIWY